MILFGVFMYLFLDSEVEKNLHTAHVFYNNIRDMLFPIVLTLSIINILIASIAIGIIVLFASHKLAGPLYRFEQVVKDIGNKNLRTVTGIRDGDQLVYCSDSIKTMVRMLKKDLQHINDSIGKLKRLVENKAKKSDILQEIEEVDRIIKEYKY